MKTIVVISLIILGIVTMVSQFIPAERIEHIVSYLTQFGF
jgi:hypothetical protein